MTLLSSLDNQNLGVIAGVGLTWVSILALPLAIGMLLSKLLHHYLKNKQTKLPRLLWELETMCLKYLIAALAVVVTVIIIKRNVEFWNSFETIQFSHFLHAFCLHITWGQEPVKQWEFLCWGSLEGKVETRILVSCPVRFPPPSATYHLLYFKKTKRIPNAANQIQTK